MADADEEPMTPQVAVLLDFDGTITQQDVGELLLDAFASPHWREEAELWHSGAITFKELNEREFAYLPAGKREEMEQFALEMAVLRAGAQELVRFCEERNIPVEIVSGGLDFYVRPLLEKFGLGYIPLSSKLADFSQGERVVPKYTQDVVVCEVSGNCKCARVWHHRTMGARVVFVGDGSSDQCVAGEADVVYARDSLAAYCQQKGIPFAPFVTLHDVVAGLSVFLSE